MLEEIIVINTKFAILNNLRAVDNEDLLDKDTIVLIVSSTIVKDKKLFKIFCAFLEVHLINHCKSLLFCHKR